MVAIVACTVVISLSDVVDPKPVVKAVDTEGVTIETIPTWIPVIFGLVTPMFFCTNGILTKSLTNDKIGFDPSILSSSAYFVTNALIMIAAIPYWTIVEFRSDLFWIGLIGGFINNMGIVLL